MSRHRAFPTKAEVVIVGGGAIGTSIAFHLAEAGVDDVLLVEKGELGSGSTTKAAGGVRTQFSDPLNVEISNRSIERIAEFGTRPGAEIDFRQVGYLFLLTTASEVEAFEESIRLQQTMGLPNLMLSASEAKELSPLIEVDDVLAASWSPGDGHATPEAMVQGYASGARGHGAVLVTNCQLTGIRRSQGEIVSVSTDRGDVATRTVICAAGVWSAAVGGLVGFSLPVQPERRQVYVTEPISGLPDQIPQTIDFVSGFYFHREGPGLMLGATDPGIDFGFDLDQTDAFMPALYEAMERRAPRLLGVGLQTGWSGYAEVTPDHNALVGEAPELSRFIYATGFSGHGFMQAPAIGEVVRDLFVGHAPEFEVEPFGVERFAAGEVRVERNVI
jgi:sarcosine oxidase, subunit beta